MEEKRYNYWELQLIKYSKGHYGSSVNNERLFHFPAKLYGYYVRDVDYTSLLHMIVELHQKLVEDNYIKNFQLKRFLSEMFRRAKLYHNKDNIGYWQIIETLMSDFSLLSIHDMNDLEFGELDIDLSYILNY